MERGELRRRLNAALVNSGRSSADRRRGAGAMPARLADVGTVRHCACQWPLWPSATDGGPRKLICSAPTADGSPYCTEHGAIAAAPAASDPATREMQAAAQAFRAAWGTWIAQNRPAPPAITQEIAEHAIAMARLANLSVHAAQGVQ